MTLLINTEWLDSMLSESESYHSKILECISHLYDNPSNIQNIKIVMSQRSEFLYRLVFIIPTRGNIRGSNLFFMLILALILEIKRLDDCIYQSLSTTTMAVESSYQFGTSATVVSGVLTARILLLVMPVLNAIRDVTINIIRSIHEALRVQDESIGEHIL